jgi:hypothetical protein
MIKIIKDTLTEVALNLCAAVLLAFFIGLAFWQELTNAPYEGTTGL